MVHGLYCIKMHTIHMRTSNAHNVVLECCAVKSQYLFWVKLTNNEPEAAGCNPNPNPQKEIGGSLTPSCNLPFDLFY